MRPVSLAIATVILALCGSSLASAQESTVNFRCDARSPDKCHFTIFKRRGTEIVLPSGVDADVRATVGDDVYCVCINRSAPSDYNECRAQGCGSGPVQPTNN